MQPTIATFVCVDTNPLDAASFYPELGGKRSAEVRRAIYWKNVLVFCATARRCYPNARIVVGTNDGADFTIGENSAQQFLARWHVETFFTPFEIYKPPAGASASFLNTFYRYDVLRALVPQLDAHDVLLLMDSDCVWTLSNADWETIVPPKTLLTCNPYGARKPFERHPNHLSRADLGELYRRLDPTYPEKFPDLYGAECIGGTTETLRVFNAEFERWWNCLNEYARHRAPRLANGGSIFDNDEWALAYVLNRGLLKTRVDEQFFRRVYTQEFPNTVRASDLNVSVWHVPGEKERGLPLLFEQARDSDSMFWRTPLPEFRTCLGGFVGIPRRRHDVPYSRWKRAERHTRAFVRRLRHYKNLALAHL